MGLFDDSGLVTTVGGLQKQEPSFVEAVSTGLRTRDDLTNDVS